MYIERIFSFINSVKNQGQNKYFTPNEVMNAFNEASISLFREKIKVYGIDKLNGDYFKNFEEESGPLELTGTTVKTCDLPSGYAYGTDFVAIAASLEAPVYLLNDSEWNERKRSALLPAESEYPIGRIKRNKLEILPITCTHALISYIRYPVDAVYAYNLSADNRSYVFSESGSVDTDWPPIAHGELIAKTCRILGVALHDTWLVQYEALLKQSE